MPFLYFKGITQEYLLKIPITHNKNLNPSLNLLNSCMLVKSTPQILSLNNECTFLFINFLIICLWSSSANCMFSLLLANCEAEDKGLYEVEEKWRPRPCDFLLKNLYTIEANPLW